jgi:nicotinamidase-related amidase
VITDPQNDFLSPKGATWGVVGESVTRNHTVENLEQLFKVAKEQNITVLYLHTTISNTIILGKLKVLRSFNA